MTETVDLYFSFRSPYSYLAAQLIQAIEDDFDVALYLRPVLPLALREPSFFREGNIERVRYLLIDWERRAEMLGLPHTWPDPDPIVQNYEDMSIAEEQPYIHRLCRLGVEAQRQGKGVAFAAAVSRLIFGGTRGWDQGSALADAVASAGLDLAAMEAAIGDGEDHDAAIAENQAMQASVGHSGVPLFVFRGEPFFGQDRIDSLRWCLQQHGLAR